MNKAVFPDFKKLHLLLCILFPGVQNANTQIPPPVGSLTVLVRDLESNKGLVLVQLFRKTDKVPTAPFKILKSECVNNTATVRFDNLPLGDYAIIVAHDLNANGVVDHEWGFPAEPLGYSNNWRLSLVSGMPNFSKLKFTFNKDGQEYLVKMPS